jgi:hypothetical protein
MTRKPTGRKAVAAIAVVAAAYGVVQWWATGPSTDTATTSTATSSTAGATRSVTAAAPLTPDQARHALTELVVRPEDTGAHYSRADWGEGWASHGHGCNTRELVLHAQGRGWVLGPSCGSVCPQTGPACWVSIYDNVAVWDPHRLQIDHVVPVAEANRSGTRNWTPQQRAAFYQDPANLVAVSASSNTSKSDDDPARWLPPNRGSWCWYAETWISTKTRYHLQADPPEVTALRSMLNTCA